MATANAYVLEQFNAATNRHDVPAMMALMTADCVFENTYPAPDGTRFTGQAEIRQFWEEFFQSSRYSIIETEQIFAMGVRCVMLWRYRWVSADGEVGHIRGVDVYTILDGLIAEKLSYVKG